MYLCPSGKEAEASEGGSNLVWASHGDLIALAVIGLSEHGVTFWTARLEKKLLCKVLLLLKSRTQEETFLHVPLDYLGVMAATDQLSWVNKESQHKETIQNAEHGRSER